MRVSGKHNDLDNVGPSLRHHTFFEMLGNFSFGDYFKAEAIPFAWRLLTEVWEIPPERLYATVFKGESGIPRDDEAHAIWQTLVPSDRIVELGLAENFWAMGDTGPCGRCSELHYHRGDHHPCAEATCQGIDCSCDRYVEIWNNVFMEFERQADGTLAPLPAPSIDTGMGLERIVAVLQDRLSNYDTDLFTPLLREIGAVTGTPYGPLEGRPSNEPTDVSLRVVADHVRAMTFLIADGVMPSNEWRGYVLRKIMRRAMRHGKRLGMTDPFLYRLVDVLVTEMGTAYPELAHNRDAVVTVIQAEEERFDKVLNDGLPRLEAALAVATAGTHTIAGDDVFRLYDTYGLPLDFIEDLAQERGLGVDRDGFERALDGQREKSRAGQAFGHAADQAFDFATESTGHELLETPDRFDGYTATDGDAIPVLALFDGERRQVDELGEGATGSVILTRTPFYVEAGRAGLRYGTAAGRQRRRRGRDRHGSARTRGAARARGPCRDRPAEDRRAGHRDGRCVASGRHSTEPHGHPSPPCGVAHDRRQPCQTGRLAGGSRPPALRLHPGGGGHRRPARRHRRHRQPADLRQHGCRDRDPQDRRGDCRRRDRALRGEIR